MKKNHKPDQLENDTKKQKIRENLKHSNNIQYNPDKKIDKIALFRALHNGNRHDYEKFINYYQNKICNYVLFNLKNHDNNLSVSLTNEIFIKFFKRIKNIKCDKAFESYLYKIAKNICIDENKKNKKESQLFVVPVVKDSEEELDYIENYPDNNDDPYEKLNKEQRNKLLYEKLNELTDEYREIIFLKHIKGYKEVEIADRLEIPIGTVKSRANRGINMLATKLKITGIKNGL